MFDLANDRIGYSELLRPDLGYTLDFAVGMTYSLDLEALLGVPVALGMLDEGDEIDLSSPLFILEAIRKSADRIALFCNAGGIKLPTQIRSVYSLLENSVFQVKTDDEKNFHPKIWVLRYSKEGCPSKIRLLVMSRNLTFDNSIDVCAALSGNIGEEPCEKNRPLSDLLHFVAPFAERKGEQVRALAEDVLRVSAFQADPPFEDYELLPIGIPGHSGKRFLEEKRTALFAVSPFLTEETVQDLTRFAGDKKTLVTRKDAVTPAVLSAFYHVYVTKDALNYNEFGAKQDIHAKMYFAMTNSGNYLYLGSANASRNAFNGNIEFLLKLKYKSYAMGYKMFCDDFLADPESGPFEEMKNVPEKQAEGSREKEIDKALREAVYALKSASVTAEGDHYTVIVKARPLKTKECIMLRPLQGNVLKQPLERRTRFSGLLLKNLSEFYVLSLEEQGKTVRSIVVKIATTNMPKDRDKEIYRTIIDSSPKFLSYLSFMLSGETRGEQTDEELLQAGAGTEDAASGGRELLAPVYEQMLRVFHENPSKLKAISDMTRRLDPDVVGAPFREMLRQFESAAKKVHR